MNTENILPDCLIRKASLKDADQVLSLVVQFTVSFKPERTAFELCLQELLADQSGRLSVCEYQGELVGYCVGLDHYDFMQMAVYLGLKKSWLKKLCADII